MGGAPLHGIRDRHRIVQAQGQQEQGWGNAAAPGRRVRTNVSSLEAGNGKGGTDAPGLFGEGDVPSVGTAYGNLFSTVMDSGNTPGQDGRRAADSC